MKVRPAWRWRGAARLLGSLYENHIRYREIHRFSLNTPELGSAGAGSVSTSGHVRFASIGDGLSQCLLLSGLRVDTAQQGQLQPGPGHSTPVPARQVR